jgi:hypothetical protein
MALRLKQHPALASLQTAIDLQRRLLLVTAPGEAQQLEVPLPLGLAACPLVAGSSGSKGGNPVASSSSGGGGGPTFSIRVCSRTACVERTASAAGGDASVAAWFSQVLGVPCRLVQQAAQAEGPAAETAPEAAAAEAVGWAPSGAAALKDGAATGEAQQPVAVATSGRGDAWASGRGRSFANEGQLLVVGAASLADLAARSASAEPAAAFAQRFRCGEVSGGCLLLLKCGALGSVHWVLPPVGTLWWALLNGEIRAVGSTFV